MNEKLQKKLNHFTETDTFKLDYTKKIEDLFDLFSYKISSNFPGVWAFIESSIDGRPAAVFQSSNIAGSQSYGTLIIPKDKFYYDFKFKVDILTKARGSFGLVFRMQDQFNYIAFEINLETGYKRVTKFVNGNLNVIQTTLDGGIPQNTWFKVEINAIKSRYIVRIGESKSHKDYDSLPIVFDFEDNTFSNGKVGLFTNGNPQFYFDKLVVSSTQCQTKWEVNPIVLVKPDNANIFVEKFEGKFGSR